MQINATGFSYNQPVVVKPITTAYSNLSVPIYAASPPAPLSPPPPRSPVPPPAPRRPPPPPPPFVLSVGGTGTTRQVFAAGALPGQTAGGPATNANRWCAALRPQRRRHVINRL